MTQQQLHTLRERVAAGHTADFSLRGVPYIIQQENNKGWDYISIWRLEPRAACLARSLFDIFDGIDGGTVDDLLSQPCLDGKSFLDCLPEIRPLFPGA